MDSLWIWEVPDQLANSERADKLILNAFIEQQGHWANPSHLTPLTLTRTQLQALIDSGHVTSNDSAIKSNFKLKPGVVVKIQFPPPKTLNLDPENIPLNILYEDEHLLVINKQKGLTVHPSLTQTQNTLVHALLFHIKTLSKIGDSLRPGIVHRLDKNTSGTMVIAKTDEAHQNLMKDFSIHRIERKYWALCYGEPTVTGVSKKIESTIGRHPVDRKKMAMNVKSGRKAVSIIKTIKSFRVASLVEVSLETGRTHQVRVHLSGLGHSLLGDSLYGQPRQKQSKWKQIPAEIQDQIKDLKGQALHARVLGFTHPVTHQKMRFVSSLPQKLSALIAALEAYAVHYE